MKSRAARLAFAVCVLTVVILAAPLAAGASWAPWMNTRLIAYDGLLDPVAETRGTPDVDGKWIVWQASVDAGPDDWNIFAYDMNTGARKDVWTAAGNQQNPAVSGDWVVLPGDQTGDWEIYAFNLATNARQRITNRAGDQFRPDISGTKVVYEDTAAGDVCLFDMATGVEATLPLGAGIQELPRISGDRVVYRQDGDIYLFDLRSSAITRITVATLLDTDADIDGTLVTWSRDTGSGWTIYCRDMAGSTVQTVASGSGVRRVSSVDGRRIVYWDDASGTIDIHIYDASVGIGETLVGTPADENDPAIDGNNVAYVADFVAPGGDITLGRLAGPSLSAQALAPIVGYGAPSTIAGSLVENGIPLGGMTVTIDKSSDGGHTWTPVGSTTTGASGAYAFPTGANNTMTYYRARYGGATRRITVSDVIDHFSAESSPVRVIPEAYLSKPSGPARKTHNTTFTSAGYLKPLHAAGTQPVIIKCYKKSGKHWNLKKTYNATISYYDSTKCKYKASVKLPTRGSWRIRAYYAPSATNAAKHSTYRYITSR